MNSKDPLTLAFARWAREQDFWLPSPQVEGLGMRAVHSIIQQRPTSSSVLAQRILCFGATHTDPRLLVKAED